jgi:hypothetical protein
LSQQQGGPDWSCAVTLTTAGTPGLRADNGVVSSSGGPWAERRRRRMITAGYRLPIVAEYDRATLPGECGALLHREGRYHWHSTWPN